MILIKFALFLFALAFVWDRLTAKYLNPYKLYALIGQKGSGKTSTLVKLALTYQKKGWKVYTNIDELCLPGVRHIDIKHLGEFVPEAHSLLLLDEVGMVWPDRDFKNFKAPVRDFFKLQRHYKVIVYIASQGDDFDKKIRILCDALYIHVNVGRVFSIGKKVVRKLVITEATSEGESRITDTLVMLPFWYWTVTYIPKYARYFNSHSVPEMPLLEYREDAADAPAPRAMSLPSPLHKLPRFFRRKNTP